MQRSLKVELKHAAALAAALTASISVLGANSVGTTIKAPAVVAVQPEWSKNRYVRFWRAAHLRMADCELRLGRLPGRFENFR